MDEIINELILYKSLNQTYTYMSDTEDWIEWLKNVKEDHPKSEEKAKDTIKLPRVKRERKKK